MLQSPTEFDHADALERGIEYAERLDKLLNAATARRDDVLRQLERYRDGLSARQFGSPEVTDYDPAHTHDGSKTMKSWTRSCRRRCRSV